MTLCDLFDMVYMKVGPQFHVPHRVQDGDCFRSIIIIEVIIKHINVISVYKQTNLLTYIKEFKL
jgi:hypothetical protein